jgi:two-component system, chemotaxis family, sensor kinase CheA
MSEDTNPRANAFREEAHELLADLEQALLEWETRLEDRELVHRIFRAMHTIKGSGAMFGFDRIAEFTHSVETVLDLVRSGQLGASAELVELTLRARDHIAELLNSEADGEPEPAHITVLRAAFTRLAESAGAAPAAAPQPAAAPKPAAAPPAQERHPLCTYRIRFVPGAGLLLRGVDPIGLLKELRGLGKASVVAHSEAMPALEEIDPERCYLSWDVLLTTERGPAAVRDVFIFVEDDSELSIELIDQPDLAADSEEEQRLGDILVQRGDIAREALEQTLGPRQPLGELLVKRGSVGAERVRAALSEQEHLRTVRSQQRAEFSQSTIRVPSTRLDALVDLVGELVTVQARLSQTATSQANSELTAVSEEVERLISELRDNAMSIRMMPIGTLFSRFNRLVRDLTQELGREVEMVISGAQTELDKTVIDRLNDPLVHLIRNSLDHGIEPPEQREAAGKPRKGRLDISAEHAGATVVIRIRDDGAGIDPGRVRARAIEKGVIAPDAQLTERQIHELIFAPGFSTARVVSDISGRGVGLDVVRRNIESLRGSLQVTSAPGQGMEIAIQLPLTLAIIDGLLVAVGDSRYIVPLSIVEECVTFSASDQAASGGRNTVTVRGQMVPFVSLREHFAIGGRKPAVEQIVISAAAGQRFGLVVDRVVSNHQTVIKALGKIFGHVTDVSGATILGDGTVALILDLARVQQRAVESANGVTSSAA